MGRAAAAAVALALLVAGSGCGERAEPTGETVRLYPVTVRDANDREVTLRSHPRRIATLTPPAENVLAALGARDRVVAPPGGFFSTSGQLLTARLRAVKPDLVVASPATEGIERPLAELAVPVYFMPRDSIREVERAITHLGLLVDKPVAARRLVHRIEAKRRLVARRLAHAARVTVFVDTGFFTTIPETSLIGDLIREAHGRSVAGANPGPEPIEPERLLRLKPDVYLATSDSGTTLQTLRRNPHTRKLAAVRERRFALVDLSLLEPGPHVGEALLVIARLLHPNAFR